MGCNNAKATRENSPMPLYALGDRVPQIHPDAFVHPDAVIIGDVIVGAESSIWPSAVLRGDSNRITIGARTSIQDGSAIHCTVDNPTVIGDGCVIGHTVHMEGCIVEDGALVGSGAVVLPRAVIGSGALVAAGAVVPNDVVVPSRALARGVPVKIIADAAPQDVINASVEQYIHNARTYPSLLRRLD